MFFFLLENFFLRPVWSEFKSGKHKHPGYFKPAVTEENHVVMGRCEVRQEAAEVRLGVEDKSGGWNGLPGETGASAA